MRFAALAVIGMDEMPVCLVACLGQGGGRSIHPDSIRPVPPSSRPEAKPQEKAGK